MKPIHLPRWSFGITEVSNGVFQVNAFDRHGRNVSTTQVGLEPALDDALVWIFNVEKSLRIQFHRFLYDLCLLKLEEVKLTRHDFNHENFGSWFIEVKDQRLLYWGKEEWLLFQSKSNEQWFDSCILRREELEFETLIQMLGQLKAVG